MKRALASILIAGSALYSQTSEPLPKFEAADVRVSPKSSNPFPFPRTGPARGGRYEVKNATMVDLIRTAHGFDADKILGGPNWLELDRFDVVGKVPAGSTPEQHKQMLQSLLADRFKLVTHPDTRPLPTYTLIVPKKAQLKEAEGSEETGCKPQTSSGAPAEGGIRLFMSSAGGSGAPVTISLGPGMVITYNCRNMTMAAFASGLRGMMGVSLGPNAVIDGTNLKGNWNFDLRFSMGLIGPTMPDGAERISIFSAVEKLGLKLEEKQVSTPVLVVDSVNRTAGENPPDTNEALPPLPVPTEFEVASVKLSDPGGMGGRFQMQPGGRLVVTGMPLRFLIDRAFNVMTQDMVVGLQMNPQDRVDVNAKLPAETAVAATGPGEMEALAPLLLKLLEDRFKLKYHREDRPVTAYTLVAAKPKMKKADPASRISCKTPPPPPGTPPGSRVLTCQNVTMEQFAERLHRLTPDMSWPVIDATGLEGGWDLTLTFSMNRMMMGGMPMRPPDGAAPGGAAGAVPTAADPIPGQTLFEAIEKQLGLKLEKRPRTASVIVIDHIETKPTEN
jgi:uncharacterized protein (TIGR03435 family)